MSTTLPPALAFELLESKLLAPRIRGGIVPREALISVLEGSRSTPVVCLSAGPGWGKTTLLAQWASRSTRPFAWLSVDEGDNDPIVLLTYVAAALDRVSPLDPSVFDALMSPGVSIEATVVPRLGAGLATMEPVVVAFDDLNVLENAVCVDAIVALTQHVSDGSQVALSARGDPALPLGALRARGLVLEIGPSDLRMQEAEASQLLSAGGVDLPEDQIGELTERTEGWSAGLYLAALAIRARSLKPSAAASFTGSNRFVSEYLQSELLAHSPPDELRFLTRTAVLDQMSGPLCDAVLEQEGSAATLESLVRSNLFLVPLGPDGEWYRYHHLFQELLRSELVQRDAELVPALLARAIEWCLANGQPETAIRYAQQTGDVDGVAQLVQRCAQPAYQSGRVATVERWIEWVDAHGGLERNPGVAAIGGLLAAVGGHPAQAERWANAAEQADSSGPLPDGSSSSDAWLALLRAVLCRRGTARMRADAERAAQEIAPGSEFRPSALLLAGISHWMEDDVERADDLFAEAAAEGLDVGAPEPAALALGQRALLAINSEAWVEAEQLADRALALVRRARLDEYPTSAVSYAVAARVALHRGETQRGHELLHRAQRLQPRLTYALPYFSVQLRLELARAYMSLADAGGARTVLREADAILRRQPELGTLPSQVAELRERLKTMHVDAPGASTLTTAELRLLPFLGTHLSFRQIGQRLYISPHTVKSQAIAIYRKLSVNSRSGAVERAREFGLL